MGECVFARVKPKCRYCQYAIDTDISERLVSYAGYLYHNVCFEKWLSNRITQLEQRNQKYGLKPLEQDELKELLDVARCSRPKVPGSQPGGSSG